MLKILDRYYESLPHTNKLNSTYRFCIRVLVNWWVKCCMRIHDKKCIINDDTIIVSLTSFPARIDKIWMTIACLLNQDYENIHIVLWLSKDQFSSIDLLPKKLLNLQDKGLEINMVEYDLRPHKKYFYSLQKWPNNNIITVDDDILYAPDIISTLLKVAKQHPNCVVCNRGIEIRKTPYHTWSSNLKSNIESSNIMPTGIGGVFYPANNFNGTPIFDTNVIKTTCLNGDDLWLNFNTRLAGHRVIYTGLKTGLVTILASQQSALCNDNCGQNKNDVQIDALNNWAADKYTDGFYCNL